jgi:immune inhibitor A
MGSGSWNQVSASGDSPAHPSAWEKWYQGWLTPITHPGPTASYNITAAELTTRTVVLLLTNKNGVDWSFGQNSGLGEYFLVENRQLTGYDAGLPACGLLVWHVDETRTSSNLANSVETRKLVDLEEADGNYDLDNNTNRGDAGDPFPGSGNQTSFTSATSPNSNFYTFGSSGVAITNISAGCATTKTATLFSIRIFVDKNNAGTEDGTAANPYNTVLEGINNAPSGSTVGIRAGSYSGAVTNVNKNVSLHALGGAATIGVP